MTKFLSNLKLMNALGRARLAGIGQSGTLAPGELNIDDSAFSNDQFHLLKLHQKYGNIFKTWWSEKITTCIVGHAAGRRFLAKNKDNMQVATIDMTPLFPLGFLRALEGEDHIKYRSLFSAAFKAVTPEAQEQSIRKTINQFLSELCEGDGKRDGIEIGRAAKIATTAIMFQLILGAQAGSKTAVALAKAYGEYTPDGMYIVIGEDQKSAYLPIKAIVEEHAKSFTGKPGDAHSLLEHIVQAGKLDDTVIGNLIHMVEFARHDVHGLWRWMLLEISDHRDYLDKIANETDPETRKILAGSVGSETIRMQQSEFIYRTVTKTFTYEGTLFPRRSRVRICIWEGHRDPEIFDDPDTFRPGRFVDNQFDTSSYAPLGLDHHRCLGANWTMSVSRMMTDELAENFVVDRISYGKPVKGHFHFEPGSDSMLAFRKKPA